MKIKKMELYMEKSSKLTIISEDNEMTSIFLIPYKGMGIYGEESTNLNILVISLYIMMMKENI